MQHVVTPPPSTDTISAEDVANACGITTIGGHLSWSCDVDGTVTFNLPGVEALNPEQQSGLDVAAQIIRDGKEEVPGLFALMLTSGGFLAAKRVLMQSRIDTPAPTNLDQSMMRLISKVTVDAENYGRSNGANAANVVPDFATVMQYVKGLIAAGEADDV